MALRQTADRVDAQMREYREEKSIAPVWAAGERIVVAVGADARGEHAGTRRQARRRMPSMRNGTPCTWRRRGCCACRKRSAIGSSAICAWPSSSAPRPRSLPAPASPTSFWPSPVRRTRRGSSWAGPLAPACGAGCWAQSSTSSPRDCADWTCSSSAIPTAQASQRGFAEQLMRTKAYLGIDESKSSPRKPRLPRYAAATAICALQRLARGPLRSLRGHQPRHGVSGRRALLRLSTRSRPGNSRVGVIRRVIRFHVRAAVLQLRGHAIRNIF